MPSPPYNPYFMPAQHTSNYQPQGQPADPNQIQPNSNVQVDPAVPMYHPNFYPYSQQQPSHPQLNMAHSSPSSQGSESMGTPPAEAIASSSRQAVAKRPSSYLNSGNSGKRMRTDEKDDDDDAPHPTEKEEGKVKATRGSRACTVCRRLKMKCVGAEQGPPCKRCFAGNHECIFEESNRGKRSSNNVRKHEQLSRSLRKMEKTLDTVLRSISNPGISSVASGMVSRSPSPSTQNAATQALLASPSPPPQLDPVQHGGSPRLHSLPDNSLNPLGLLAEASLANRRVLSNSKAKSKSSDSQDGTEAQKVGVANETYFKPGPMTILPLRRLYIERQVQPEMLSFTSTEEVVSLFEIFFEHMNMHCNLLDPEFHTPSLVCSRSPFLLTTICAVSSKFYTSRPELHSQLTNLARKLAFSVPERGYKSVEIVQAYILLALWGCGPVERYEQDKTWLLLGMAIRMGTDLNLHRKTAMTGQDTQEGRARDKEVHNRERTWVLCFILDRSISAQMGKPHSIKEDAIIRNVSRWWLQPTAVPADAGLSAYAELQRILSRSLEILYSGTSTASGLQTHCDYYTVIRTIESQILDCQQEWEERNILDRSVTYNRLFGMFYLNYATLVVNSFGLQNALERNKVDIGYFFARCHTAATACATLVRDELGPRGYLRYSPDSHFVQCSYAVLSLLKLIRPEFQAYLENEQKTLALVNDVANLLEKIAAGPLHTPALYSTFLKALISARLDNGTTRSNSPSREPIRKNGDEVSTNDVDVLPLDVPIQQPQQLMIEPHLESNPMEFQFSGEMGQVVDVSTFPPIMAPHNPHDDGSGMLSMDSILSGGFWDSVLIPGYSHSMEGLSGGFVYGAGGSGLITSRFGTPTHSGATTPMGTRGEPISQNNLMSAFEHSSDRLKVNN